MISKVSSFPGKRLIACLFTPSIIPIASLCVNVRFPIYSSARSTSRHNRLILLFSSCSSSSTGHYPLPVTAGFFARNNSMHSHKQMPKLMAISATLNAGQ
jgi:hypothetical protein